MSEIMTALNNKASERLKSLQDGEEEPEDDIRVTDIRHFMTSTLGRLLINESDGVYDSKNFKDTKMSEVNDAGFNKKADEALKNNIKQEEIAEANKIKEGEFGVGVVGIKSTDDIKKDIGESIKKFKQKN